MSTEYNVGDVVQLKSGGPSMVVTLIETFQGDNFAHCRWFNNNEAQDDVFPTKAIILASDPMLYHTRTNHLDQNHLVNG